MWTYVPRKSVQTILNATFPNYRKVKVAIQANGKCHFSDLNWSGGSRSEYRSCTLDGRSLASMANYNQMAPWDPRQIEGQSVDIPRGACIVSAGTFCGKPATAVIHVHPDDMAKLLPAPDAN